jgi:Fasciclin domain
MLSHPIVPLSLSIVYLLQQQHQPAGNDRSMMPQIVDVDIEACNGVVHAVNQVMLPFLLSDMPSEATSSSVPSDMPSLMPSTSPSSVPSDMPSLMPSTSPSVDTNSTDCMSITEIACSTADTSTLCGLLGQYDLDGALDEEGAVWTVFAPVNTGFDAVSSVLPTLTPDQVTDILLFHAVADVEVISTDLVCGDVSFSG